MRGAAAKKGWRDRGIAATAASTFPPSASTEAAMKQATYEDANLILRLYDLRREEKLRAARKWFGSIAPIESREEFLKRCPAGSDENAYFRMVTTYWEMAAAFVSNGILNRDLFYRSNNMELLFVWE